MLPGWKLVELRLGALSFFRLKNGLFGEKKENHVPCSEALVPVEVELPKRPWAWQGARGAEAKRTSIQNAVQVVDTRSLTLPWPPCSASRPHVLFSHPPPR